MLLAINPTSTPPHKLSLPKPLWRSSNKVPTIYLFSPTKGKQQTVKRFSIEDQIHK